MLTTRLVFCLSLLALPAWAESAWKAARDVEGVGVESRETTSKYHEHRGRVMLCGKLESVLKYVSDVDALAAWVPHTGAAKKLEETPSGIVYHVVTLAPWPYKPRDMIYALDVHLQGASAKVTMKGLPRRIAPQQGTVRMQAADGVWTFTTQGEQIEVVLQLWIDPGGGPKLLVNRRAGTTVGKMLANLRSEFACKQKLK